MTETTEPKPQPRPGKAEYPAQWQHVGCGMCAYKIMGPFVSGRDDEAFKAAGQKVREHVKEAHPGSAKR